MKNYGDTDSALNNAKRYISISHGSDSEITSGDCTKLAKFIEEVRDTQFAEYASSRVDVMCSLNDLNRLIDAGVPVTNELDQRINITAADAQRIKDDFQVDPLKIKIDLCHRLYMDFSRGISSVLFSEEVIDQFLDDLFGFGKEDLIIREEEGAVQDAAGGAAVVIVEPAHDSEYAAIMVRLQGGMDALDALNDALGMTVLGGAPWSSRALSVATLECYGIDADSEIGVQIQEMGKSADFLRTDF